MPLRVRIAIHPHYLPVLRWSLILSTVLLPLSADWFIQSVQAHMPVQFRLSYTDILKLSLFIAALVTFSVTLALIYQYHWLVKNLEIAVQCDGVAERLDKGTQSDNPPPSPAALRVPPVTPPTVESGLTDEMDPSDAIMDTPLMSEPPAKLKRTSRFHYQ